jgi:hypothetical protein
MIFKLKIHCEFQSKGCEAVVIFEKLAHHLNECHFNPNVKKICEECGDTLEHKCYIDLKKLITSLKNENTRLRSELNSIKLKNANNVSYIFFYTLFFKIFKIYSTYE